MAAHKKVKQNKARNQAWQWLILTAVTVLCITVLTFLRLPAAPMVGAIIGGIAAAQTGINLKIPKPAFLMAQSLLGLMIAKVFSLSVLQSLASNWLLVGACVLSVLTCSFMLGFALEKRKVLPGTTALWGSWPGGASLMTVMSQNYGADMRLVALMQYSRVIMIAVSASVAALFLGVNPALQRPAFFEYMFPATPLMPFLFTLALALFCIYAGIKLRFGAGPMVLAMLLGSAANNSGFIALQTPPWIMVICYLAIGWSIGLRFNRELVLYSLKVLPQIFASVATLLILCPRIK